MRFIYLNSQKAAEGQDLVMIGNKEILKSSGDAPGLVTNT